MARLGSLDDTIVAPATAAGEAAIAIVRLSGPEARVIGARLAPAPAARSSHRLYRARLRRRDGAVLDDAMIVEMHGPHSYTGEDVVELHLHGSRGVVDAVLEACLDAGARLAEPGELTLRAFVRGRMDLTQAEAVADLIGSASEIERDIALSQLGGGLSQAVAELLGELEDVLAAWRALLDFPEQVGDEVACAEDARLERVRERLRALIAGARLDLGRKQHAVLCGAPNVGKSSLLNALVGKRRVLVDAAPGTTRDPVEVELGAGGARVSIWDTAGIRPEAVGLEREGIALAWQQVERADTAVWLVDLLAPVWPPAELGGPVVVAGSKADLASAATRAEVERAARLRGLRWWGALSVRSGEGVADLRAWLAREERAAPGDAVVVVRERHVEALRAAEAALARVAAGGGLTLDVLAVEVEQAAKALGGILGRDVDLEVLDRIFAEFCLGK